METFTWKPAPGASLTMKPTVEVAKYGDGYEQRVATMINSQLNKWTLKFPTMASVVVSFLKARGGVEAFMWTDPTGVTSMYVCREWKLDHIAADIYAVACDFEEVEG